MANNFHVPPVGFGPGSQPVADDSELAYLPLPSGMRTYSTHLVDLGAAEQADADRVRALLKEIGEACHEAAQSGTTKLISVADLPASSRRLLAETLGDGEVSCLVGQEGTIKAQEAVFAGVWAVHGPEIDAIEVAPLPQTVIEYAFVPAVPAAGSGAACRPGVVNAPALVSELTEKSACWRPDEPLHVINLSLLPHTPEDLDYLGDALGTGSARILSRGYGNCRISATALQNVWRVQYFNSMDTLILDTFEVTTVPEVAVAASEDFADSAERIAEILETFE